MPKADMTNLELTRQSLRRIETSPASVPLVCAATPAYDWTTDAQIGLDDKTLAYVLEVRPAFDLLRDAASQLAALLVLAAAGGRSAQDNPVFALARSALAEARDIIGTLVPGPQGAHHHRHLMMCVNALAAAFREASKGLHNGDNEAALTLLREALRQLHFAAGALPGFEVVAFGQACCATHGVARKGSGRKFDG